MVRNYEKNRDFCISWDRKQTKIQQILKICYKKTYKNKKIIVPLLYINEYL